MGEIEMKYVKKILIWVMIIITVAYSALCLIKEGNISVAFAAVAGVFVVIVGVNLIQEKIIKPGKHEAILRRFLGTDRLYNKTYPIGRIGFIVWSVLFIFSSFFFYDYRGNHENKIYFLINKNGINGIRAGKLILRLPFPFQTVKSLTREWRETVVDTMKFGEEKVQFSFQFQIKLQDEYFAQLFNDYGDDDSISKEVRKTILKPITKDIDLANNRKVEEILERRKNKIETNIPIEITDTRIENGSFLLN